MYDRFSESYNQPERDKYNLIRVDSTIVSDLSGKLKGKKLIKYSVSFDGFFPAGVEIFNIHSYVTEENALPEAVLKQVKKDTEHRSIYIIDRGVQSARAMKESSQKDVKFVIRARENRKHVEIESLIKENQDLDIGDNLLIKDSIINLYTGVPIINKRGNKNYQEEKVENRFRLVVVKNKEQSEKYFWFITNDFKLSAKEVADYYRRRWDIEVFSDLSNKNSMSVILYRSVKMEWKS